MPEFDPRRLLGEVPEASFFNAVKPFSTSPIRRQFFGGQFPNVENQFLGAVGRDLLGGQQPTRQFENFLGNFDFEGLFRSQPRFNRGASSQFFNPRTRFLFGF